MVYRRSKSKRVRKQKRNYKKKGMSSKKLNVNMSLQPFSQRYICKMKYAQDVVTSAGGLSIFNLNSIYQPDPFGGHQPFGTDQLSVLYGKYRVISCGWRVTTTTTGQTIQLGTIPINSNITSTMSNFAELKENPRAKYTIQRDGASTSLVSGKISLPSLVGRSRAEYMADDRYQAATTANPQEITHLRIYTANNVGTFIPAVVNVLLEYTVEFFDTNQIAQSTV